MKVAIASDHRGFHLKEKVISLLKSKGHTVIDDGPASEASVDYPDFAALVAKKVSSGEVERGILICGTGIGMAISANKFPGVRAAAGKPPIWLARAPVTGAPPRTNVADPGTPTDDECRPTLRIGIADRLIA